MEQNEINELIDKAKSENPQMATVLGLMDLTYNEGIEDCIKKIQSAVLYPVDGIGLKFINRDNLITSLTKLKKQ